MSDERLGGGSPNSSWRSRAEWLAGRAEVQVEQPVADQAGQLEPLPGDLLLVWALLAPVMPTRTIPVRTARKRTRSPGKIGLAGAEVVQAPAEQVALQVRSKIPKHC